MSKKKKQKITHHQPSTINHKIVNICDKIIEYGIYAIVFFTPLVFWLKTYDEVELIKMILIFNITLFIVIAWIIKSIEKGKIYFRKDALVWGAMIYLVALILSTITSRSIWISLYGVYTQYQGLFVNLAYIILFLVILHNFQDEVKIKKTLFFITLSAPLVAIFGILQRFEYDIIPHPTFFGGRSSSTLGHPIFLGNFLVMVIPLNIIFLIMLQSFWARIYFSFSIIIMFLSLLFTYSRGPYLAFIGSIILLTILLRKEVIKKYNLIWILGLLIICVSLPITFSSKEVVPGVTLVDRISSTVDLEKGGTVVARFVMWKISLNILKDYPIFGIGLDCFKFIFREYQLKKFTELEGIYRIAPKAHNEFFQIAATCGFIGIFASLFLFITILIKGLKVLKTSSNVIPNFFIISGIISSLFAYLIQLQSSYTVITTGVLCWVYIGIIGVIDEPKYRKNEREMFNKKSKRKNIVNPFIYIILFLISIIGLIIINKPLLADYYFKRGVQIYNTNKLNYQEMLPYFKKAVELNPLVMKYHFMLGNCYGEIGELDLAEQELLNTLKFQIGEPSVYHNLGIICNRKGDYERAIYYFTKAVQKFQLVDPYFPQVYLDRGIVYGKKGLEDLAIKDFNKALQLNPKYAEAYFNRGVAYYKKKLYDKAIKDFKKASDLGDKNAKEILKRYKK